MTMLFKSLARGGLVGLAMLSAGAASADDDLIDASDAGKLAELFRGFGSARLDKAADDTPAIRGRIEGNAFSVYFYGCNDQKVNCSTINLTASWDVDGAATLDQINAWNAGKRFGRAYVDADGNAVVETDINLSGSVTYANMEGNIDWWRIIMADFKANVIDAPAGGESAAAPEAPAANEAAAAPDAPEAAPEASPADATAASRPGSAPRGPFAIPRKPNAGD